MDSRALFARNLAHYLKERGLSQGELARRMSVERSTVSHWVRETASPDVAKLSAIATILGIEVAQLFMPPGSAAPSAAPLSVDELALTTEQALRALARSVGLTISVRKAKA